MKKPFRSIAKLLETCLRIGRDCDSAVGETVHEFRRSTKDIRAIFDLVSLAPNRRLRRLSQQVAFASRNLSYYRDQEVVQTGIEKAIADIRLQSLANGSNDNEVTACLSNNSFRLPTTDITAAIEESCQILKSVQADLGRSVFDISPKVVSRCLTQSYKSGRSSVQAWFLSKNADDMHVVRKRVKRLASQLNYCRKWHLGFAKDSTLIGNERQAKAMGYLLGELRDVQLMQEWIITSRSTNADLAESQQILNYLGEKKHAFELVGSLLASKFYFGSPNSFRMRLQDKTDEARWDLIWSYSMNHQAFEVVKSSIERLVVSPIASASIGSQTAVQQASILSTR